MLPSPHLFPFRLLQLDAMDAFLIAPRPTSLLPRQQQQNWRMLVSKAFDTAAQIHSESLSRIIHGGASARAQRHTHTRLEDDGPGADPYVALSSSTPPSQAAQCVIETTRLLSISPSSKPPDSSLFPLDYVTAAVLFASHLYRCSYSNGGDGPDFKRISDDVAEVSR